MTGEPLAVKKDTDSYAYAGTVVEEAELAIRVERDERIHEIREDRIHDRRNG